MKIIYLAESNLPSEAANSVHVMNMCSAISQLGHDVTLFAQNGVKKQNNLYDYYGVLNNFKIWTWGKSWIKGRMYIFCFLSVIKILAIKPDLVWSRSLFGMYLMSFFNIRFIFDNHDDFRTHTNIQKKWFEKVIHSSNLILMTTNSKALKDALSSKYEFLNSKIVVANNGASNDFTINAANNFVENKNLFHIGYVGTIGKGRGIELILEMAKNMSDFDFHIIGGSKNEITTEFNLEPTSNVHFYGFVSPSETAFYRSKCDVLIAPYQLNVTIRSGKTTSNTMSPIKLFEYMKSQKVIIASNISVLHEVLNSENSILVNPEKVEEWQLAINSVYKDKELYNKLSKNAFADFCDNYTWSKRAERIINEVVKRKNNISK